ncbi:MAG: hypothetical protein IPG32_13535 [Saprospirales bacterium]|nr:hypothetical protein [Saprospirales bacterium]
MGDLVAIHHNEFLLVRARRNATAGTWRTSTRSIFPGATALTTEDFDGQTLEQVGNASGFGRFRGVIISCRKLVFDLFTRLDGI